MSKQPKSHLKRLTTFDYINSAILLLVAVCCVYPFLYVFFVATTDGTYLARGEMTFLPMGFNLKAFGYILTNPRFNVFGGMRNSFMYTLLGTLLAVACTYVTAYVLSRPRFKHRFWLMSLFIITWVFDAGIIPQYIMPLYIYDLGWTNKLVGRASAASIILLAFLIAVCLIYFAVITHWEKEDQA